MRHACARRIGARAAREQHLSSISSIQAAFKQDPSSAEAILKQHPSSTQAAFRQHASTQQASPNQSQEVCKQRASSTQAAPSRRPSGRLIASKTFCLGRKHPS
eukprot:3778786-Lingulodinium_polyedra.AAC.1